MMKGRKMKMARWNGGEERGRREDGMGEKLKEDQRTPGKFQRERQGERNENKKREPARACDCH